MSDVWLLRSFLDECRGTVAAAAAAGENVLLLLQVAVIGCRGCRGPAALGRRGGVSLLHNSTGSFAVAQYERLVLINVYHWFDIGWLTGLIGLKARRQLVVGHHCRLLLYNGCVLLHIRCVLLIRRRGCRDILRRSTGYHQSLPIHLYELLLSLMDIGRSHLAGVERHLLIGADIGHNWAQLVAKGRGPIDEKLSAVGREKLRGTGAVLLYYLAGVGMRRPDYHSRVAGSCGENALTRTEDIAVALHRRQNVLPVDILNLQLHTDVARVLQQSAVGGHHHTAETRNDELLDRREVLHHTSGAVQQIDGLQ